MLEMTSAVNIKMHSPRHSIGTTRITFGNAPMFVDLKFSGWRLFWLCAIICYARVDLREYEKKERKRKIERERDRKKERETEAGRERNRPSCLFGTERTLNRIIIQHSDIIHLHYYFSFA